ncbi:related to isotrichodermin C-15 hydroxylase (cytochrome P-450 monooxygenase CYP65A1) [Fusarium torulosum]|uniref:Related to isotrichodermin C-15 hydroxylase (Cytochrome P-450 monooxygenase CYP65A1) n=1 Tax=Fusarium torulosum TaxID=33205 RepID=A0AAE8M3G9_9HYPO|nr:related to isotrichodermin C-15 hydroxylase (cytochrome P-450 monooxygenase CYP65A1) [Fusarium torulosum]
MAVVSKILGFPSLALAAVVESFLAIKLFPEYYSTQSHLAAVATILAINYAFGVVFWMLLYPIVFSPLRGIPGPKAYVSAAHRSLVVKDKPAGDLFLELAEKYPGQDLIMLNSLRDQVCIMNPQLLADLLVHNCYDFTKPKRISSFLRHVLGDGLIIVEGETHKFLRKNTTPAFHFRHIKELYPMMWTKGETLTKALKEDMFASRSSVVELNSWASKVTLDIIGIAGLGRKLDTVEKKQDPLADVFEQLLEPSREKLVFSMLALAVGLKYVRLIPWQMNNVFNYLTGSLNELCYPMIKEKKAAIIEKGDDHFDVLSLLIKTNNFSDEALKDQLLTFLAAGHETTASALTWACYLLTKNPEIQAKVREEVMNALPEDLENNMTNLAGILEQLPYLNGVMHETLRLYPTVPLTMRQAIRDTRIGDQFIPEGTDIIVSIWYINRSPVIWGPDAAEFRPERWITSDGKPNQNGGASSNYNFLTFLHGPRSCIGQGFAKAEMRCLLATMVRSFEWTLAMDDGLVMPRGVITIKPENGMYLNLKSLQC